MNHTVQAKKKNKGFSMVELIIVIAIMAVLAGILAPTLIKYLQKTRRTKDVTIATEIKNAFERAVTNNLVDDIGSSQEGTVSVTVDSTYTYNNPPQDIVEAAFLELGFVPVPSTGKEYSWLIVYSPKDNAITEIYLVDDSKQHELYPDSDKFLEMED